MAPLLEPFLGDPSEDVRRQVADLLKAMAGAGAIPLLAKALADSSEDIRDRASLQLYANYKPEQLAAGAMLGAAVDAFIGGLGLKVNFLTSASSLYSEPQIEPVRRAINSAIPQ